MRSGETHERSVFPCKVYQVYPAVEFRRVAGLSPDTCKVQPFPVLLLGKEKNQKKRPYLEYGKALSAGQQTVREEQEISRCSC